MNQESLAKQVLQETFGYQQFRPGQETIIDTALAGRDCLVVMPTGGGKSLCYQVPALVLPVREDGEDREIWIFVEDGYLRAATVKSGDVVSAKDGKNITPLRSMDPRIAEADLLEISLRSDSASAVSRIWMPGIGGDHE